MKKIFITFIVATFATAIFSQASWTYNTSNIVINPTTANLGIGGTQSNAKLSVLQSNTTLLGSWYGIYSSISGTGTDKYSGYFTGGKFAVMNGNVGIGTTTPQFTLDVSGSGRFTDNVEIVGNNSDGASKYFAIKNPTKTGAGQAAIWKFLNMTGSYGNSFQIWAYGINDASGCGNGGLCNNRFTITDSGNVGIGTTTPQYPLEVQGTMKSTTGVFNNVGIGITNPNAALQVNGKVIMTNGKVGVDTENPQTTFQVSNYSGLFVSAQNIDPAGNYNMTFLKNTGSLLLAWNRNAGRGEYDFISNRGAGNMGGFAFYDYTNAGALNHLMTIQGTTGNVGIGTTNPQFTLDVSGGGRFTDNVEIVGGNTDGVSKYLSIKNPNKTGAGQVAIWKFLNTTGSLGNSFQIWAYGINDASGCGNGGICENRFTITDDGNVGIGTRFPCVKLDVIGTIRAEEVKVCLNQGCDFVFDKDYNLMPLNKLSEFISENKHLPEIAPAAIMESEGINISEMNAKLLQKVEELTLYIIELNKRIEIFETSK